MGPGCFLGPFSILAVWRYQIATLSSQVLDHAK